VDNMRIRLYTLMHPELPSPVESPKSRREPAFGVGDSQESGHPGSPLLDFGPALLDFGPASERGGPGGWWGQGRGGEWAVAGQVCRAVFKRMPEPERGSTSTAPVRELRRNNRFGSPDRSAALTTVGSPEPSEVSITSTLVPAVT
jgi:hypothetical protein